MSMRGILRSSGAKESPSSEGQEFDRNLVLKNTELNSQLGIEGEKLRKQIHLQTQSHNNDGLKKKFPKTKAPAALKESELNEENENAASEKSRRHAVDFDSEEISSWDSQRGRAMKINEPITPYMGTAKDTEYYDPDPVPEDLDLSGHA